MARRFTGIGLGILFALLIVTPAMAQGPCGVSVTVTYRDSLTAIAGRCGTTVEALIAANPELAANPNRVIVGQELRLFPAAQPAFLPTLAVPVVPPIAPPLGVGIAAVTIFPVSGPPGTEVNVIANGFPANERVLVGIGLVNTAVTVIERPTLGAEGAFQAVIPIPATAQPGESWVITVASESGMAGAVSYPFTVTDALPATAEVAPITPTTPLPPEVTVPPTPAPTDTPTPPPTFTPTLPPTSTPTPPPTFTPTPAPTDTATPPPTFTLTPTDTLPSTANIYLIALNDNGVSGPPVGCGDSAIPVTIDIEPTAAPLTAALDALLALRAEFNAAGFYNALSQSVLTLEGVSIVDGVATISLTGTLIQGGVCDAPRIIAQLEFTALQYPTVSDVVILINGEPFELGEAEG